MAEGATPGEALLTVTGLTAGYDETTVIEDIGFSLPVNGALAVLGRNGVGKTTLLATLMGRTDWRSGGVRFAGQSIERLPVHQRCRMGLGYVPQTREIFPSLSVAENLAIAARPAAKGESGWTLERVYELFPRLAERRQNGGNQLSGGEQQMLAIGRALMGNPRLLLLDEPMEGLAPVIVDMLVAALDRLISREHLAVILVEQHARLALAATREAIVMSRGRIVHSGPSGDLLAHPDKLAALIVEH